MDNDYEMFQASMAQWTPPKPEKNKKYVKPLVMSEPLSVWPQFQFHGYDRDTLGMVWVIIDPEGHVVGVTAKRQKAMELVTKATKKVSGGPLSDYTQYKIQKKALE